MYRFTLLMCTYVLCIHCVLSLPTSLLSDLLSPSTSAAAQSPASPSAAAAAARQKPETGLTTYDQKQSGKYNIHLNIKDVAIIALDAGQIDGGVGNFDEDYYADYDLSDFTVKPIFGLHDISSEKPPSVPLLIHTKPDEDAEVANQTESAVLIEEPIIKDPINKTQSVIILSGDATPFASDSMNENNSTSTGIVVTTSTPAPEDLPPKLSLADIAHVQSAQKPFPTKPNEIPVQIVLEQHPAHKESSRQRPNTNWHSWNRVRVTPSANRQITPPHDDLTNFGNEKHRKVSYTHTNRRNCVLNQNGQCENSNRRFNSPLNGILSLLSLLSPHQIEKLE